MATESTDNWLHRVFSAERKPDQKLNYDEWADSYDGDMLAVGYLNPGIVAGLVARYLPDREAGILDAAAGTGIGEFLHILGSTRLTGVDISGRMLSRARDRGVYAELQIADLSEPLPFANAHFGATISSGAFSAFHVPSSALTELVRVTRPGGIAVWNIGGRALTDLGFEDSINRFIADGKLALLERTIDYRPMPMSDAMGQAVTRCFAFRVL